MTHAIETGPQRLPTAVKTHNWPMALVLCVLIGAGVICMLTVAGVIIYALGMPGRVVQSSGEAMRDAISAIAPAFRPNVQVNTLLLSTLDDIKSTPKLVVQTASITATVDKSSTATWGYLNFGTTTVRVVAKDNQVQYVIPLEGLATSSFRFDPSTRRLIVFVPRPSVDTQMVSVQSDPSKISIETSNGWAKLDRYSGAPLRDEAKMELRNEVVLEGLKPLVRKEADTAGKALLTKLLKPVADQLRSDVTLDIHYLNEEGF